jgi:hypothetical protein
VTALECAGSRTAYSGPHVANDELVRRQVTLATAAQELAERWRIEGCKAFDEGDTPAEVAEAAGILRCALELSHLLDTLMPEMRAGAPDRGEIFSFASERREGPRERRRKTRTDRRKRS